MGGSLAHMMLRARKSRIGGIQLALTLLLPSFLARAQVLPGVSSDAKTEATLNAQAQRVLDENAIRILQGRPGIAILGVAVVKGAASSLTNESLRDAAELVLRRNGIPILPLCVGGAENCGRLVVMVRADCVKNLLLPDTTALCGVYLRVGYRELFRSGRPKGVPIGVFGEVLDDDGIKLTTDKFEESALKQLTEWIEKFVLSYLRANPVH